MNMDRNSFYDNLKSYNSLQNFGRVHSSINNRVDFYDALQHHGIKGQKWGIRRYQNPDGTLTEEGKQRYLNSDGSLTDKAIKELKPNDQAKLLQMAKQQQQPQNNNQQQYQDDYIYDKQKQTEKLNNAKQNKMYDLNFVETIQNVDDMSDDECNKEYAKYLKNPRKYMQDFDADAYNRNKANNTKQNSKQETKEVKEAPSKEIEDKAKSAFGPKATPEEESEFWKSLAKEYEKGNIKGSNTKSKPSKDEKKQIKEAKKQVEKNLKGGLLSNWALLNKAMDELGISSADQKNMSASDWNAVNDKIQELRGSKKKD